MPGHIGIVAITAEGAALCYTEICAEGGRVLGLHFHPEITLHTYSLSEYLRHIEAGRWEQVGGLILASARKLVSVGADFLICPDNLVHRAIDEICRDSPLPWLHIAEEVVSEAVRRGYKRLGLLGAKDLLEGPVYAARFAARSVDYVIPEAQMRLRINQLIFDELTNGIFSDSTRSFFQAVITGFKDRGCDAVVLGCTELPLLISEADSPLPTLDSTRILARAAVRRATMVNVAC